MILPQRGGQEGGGGVDRLAPPTIVVAQCVQYHKLFVFILFADVGRRAGSALPSKGGRPLGARENRA